MTGLPLNIRRFAPVLLALWGVGCTMQAPLVLRREPQVPTPEERNAMQSHVYEAPLDLVFASTIAVLQDIGWQLNSVDKASGLIRAGTAKRPEALSPKEEKITDFELRKKTVQKRKDAMDKWMRWEEMTIHTEPWAGGKTRQRIVMVRSGSLPPMTYVMKSKDTKAREVMVNAPAQEESVEILLPEVYGDLFDRVQKAIEKRQGQ